MSHLQTTIKSAAADASQADHTLKKKHLIGLNLQFTHILSLADLVQVRSSSNNDDLSVLGIAEVCSQLSLPWSIPADVEEDLNHNKYYDDSKTG